MNKRKLNILLIALPIVAVIIIAVVVILLVTQITPNNYFNALNNSPYSKLVQTTSITEGEVVVYEKQEILINDNGKYYHKIIEKNIADGYTDMYTTTTTEYYYNNNTMYYYENGMWLTKDFDVNNKLIKYNFNKKQFNDLNYDTKVKTTGTLTGTLKNDSTATALNSQLNDASVKIVVDKNFNVNSFEVVAKTTANRNVVINNTYTYVSESVTLPI